MTTSLLSCRPCHLLKMVFSIRKELTEQILFQKGTKTILTELPALKMYLFPLCACNIMAIYSLPYTIIDPDKKGYKGNIFLISPQKPMLWVLM